KMGLVWVRCVDPFIDAGGNANEVVERTLSIGNEQEQKNCKDAAANGKNSPHQALPRRRDGIGNNLPRGWDIVLRPRGDLPRVVGFNPPPPGKDEQRLVVRIVDKNKFQTVVVGVAKNGTQ